MSADNEYSRRGFLVGAVAAGSGLVLLAKHGGAGAGVAQRAGEAASVGMMASCESQLFLFDPDHADACRALATCESVAIVGDRVRFALDLFAADRAPTVITGVSTYADFILLTGTAAEHGYRVLEDSPQGPLVSWKIARLRRPTSSG